MSEFRDTLCIIKGFANGRLLKNKIIIKLKAIFKVHKFRFCKCVTSISDHYSVCGLSC